MGNVNFGSSGAMPPLSSAVPAAGTERTSAVRGKGTESVALSVTVREASAAEDAEGVAGVDERALARDDALGRLLEDAYAEISAPPFVR